MTLDRTLAAGWRCSAAAAGLCVVALASPNPVRAQDQPAVPASPADAAPLPEPQPLVRPDPCAPVRRISPEFGAAFAALDAGNAEIGPTTPATEAAGGLAPPLDAGDATAPWQPPALNRAGLPPPSFLASRLVPVGRTGFDREWRKVRDVTVSRACATALLGPAPPPSRALLATVSGWVNHRVRYVEDVGGDRWTDAATTLRTGVGDCEDIAIAKMQLLAALGVPEAAMYLSLVRDLVRRRDHAVLIVRLDGRPWLLEDSTDRVLDAAGGNDYRPMISFSGSHQWVHGQER